MSEKILEVKDLHVSFRTYAGVSHAVRGVDFYLNKGETLAIVGESGCGKTVTSKAIMGLLAASNTDIKKDGESAILFQGENLLNYGEKQMSQIRGKRISMIFQDPMTYVLESDDEDRRSDHGKHTDPPEGYKGRGKKAGAPYAGAGKDPQCRGTA